MQLVTLGGVQTPQVAPPYLLLAIPPPLAVGLFGAKLRPFSTTNVPSIWNTLGSTINIHGNHP
ncbi:hypothetical protein FRB94_013223 [Tulasnella sp. JGI-2019a]|nr:hypothetical protein FRB94_013223 [Tulasnella sp. JGI-2019a]